MTVRRIIHGDNLDALATLATGSVDLVYVDPPFNTRRAQRHTRIRVTRDDVGGKRVGFQGHRYTAHPVSTRSFEDRFDDFIAFLEPRLRQAVRVLAPKGSLFVHLDYREVHYVKVLLDRILGRDRFMNEIIWAYDYGGRPRRRWAPKHDNILWYVNDPRSYTFHTDAVDRVPYMAPGLVGPEKAKRGKLPTDVWWQTIVPTRGSERTGYPTQKPVAIIDRIVRVHSSPGDLLLDFFAGSGTLGEAAARHDRGFILIDSSPEAIRVMKRRLAFANPTLERMKTAPARPRSGKSGKRPAKPGARSEA
jgi:site-specific DNA-methyltransferase (adenine-specific)